MKRTARRWFQTVVAVAFISLGALTGTARADLFQFTLIGTANSDGYGYDFGQSYTFQFAANNSFENNASSYFNADINRWGDDSVSDTPIFTDVSGDGLTGAWQRPVIDAGDPNSYIEIWNNLFNTHQLILQASNDGEYSLGLQINDTDVVKFQTFNLEIGNIFSFPASYTAPNLYFAGVAGTYTPDVGFLDIYLIDDTIISFTLTEVTISAIPEPSTALLAGLGLVALLFRRRAR